MTAVENLITIADQEKFSQQHNYRNNLQIQVSFRQKQKVSYDVSIF